MLLSMTGQGAAELGNDQLSVTIELRSVNSRFLKVNFGNQDTMSFMVPQMEARIRERIRRGTINTYVRLEQLDKSNQYRLETDVLQAYAAQLQKVDAQPDLSALLALPGVVSEIRPDAQQDAILPLALQALDSALAALNLMRQQEGQNMAEELLTHCQRLETLCEQIRVQSPQVVEQYAARLEDRINQLLQKSGMEIERREILREIGVFADRCDIAEEIVRLTSHINQFRSVIGAETSDGRKLDFLTQELLRETNTIGSKASDAQIAECVVEMKTVIERIRELVQNVE